MTMSQFDEFMILTFSLWFLAMGCLFAMIWQTSRVSMDRQGAHAPEPRAATISWAGW